MADDSERSITKANYWFEIEKIRACYKDEPRAGKLIDHADDTLAYYFKTHTKPLRRKTVYALVVDYLDRKLENPNFEPLEGVAYLTNRLKRLDALHEAEFRQSEKANALDGKVVSRKFADLSPQQMQQVIDSMRQSIQALSKHRGIFVEPDMDAGIDLLDAVLKEKGPEATIELIRWGDRIIDETGMVTSQDLDEDEPTPPNIDTDKLRALFRKSRPNIFNICTFLSTRSWIIGGTVVVLEACPSLADKAYRAIERNISGTESPHNMFGDFNHVLHATGVVGAAELLIGISLIYEGFHAWKHQKFDQISNVFAKAVKKEPFKTYMESTIEDSIPAKRAR